VTLRVALLSFWFPQANAFCARALADPDVELAAIWDADPIRGQEKATEYGTQFRHRVEDVLSDPSIDAVCICSEPITHPPVAVAALENGKHVLIEKPMALTASDAERIVAAEARSDKQVMCTFNLRFAPMPLYVKEVVDSGELGRITRVRMLHGHYDEMEAAEFDARKVEARWGDPYGEGRHTLYYSGSHVSLWYEWMFGVPQRVLSMGRNVVDGLSVHDNSSVLLDYGDFVGVLEVSETLPAQLTVAEIYGTEGAVVQSRGNLPSTRVNAGSLQGIAVYSRAKQSWRYPRISAEFLRHEAKFSGPGQFFEALKSGARVPSTAAAGLRSIRILEAAELSERTGRVVSLAGTRGGDRLEVGAGAVGMSSREVDQ
jgi:predicted dehydrogenase